MNDNDKQTFLEFRFQQCYQTLSVRIFNGLTHTLADFLGSLDKLYFSNCVEQCLIRLSYKLDIGFDVASIRKDAIVVWYFCIFHLKVRKARTILE